jgi:cyclohexa-1,5-dienecarbonyl-CoA hydratase
VLRIVLDRPKGNVLSRAMMSELAGALDAHRDHSRLRMVLLRGAGGNFSFGAAVEEHRPDQVADLLRAFHGLVRGLAAYPVPVVALVEGRCLGGAFEAVLACHAVLAAHDARFGCPEIRLGVFPPVLAAAGALRLGGALAERLMLTGDEIDAATARAAGLVAAVAEPGDDLEAWALAWYRQRLAPLSAFSLRVAARAAREGSGLLAALASPLDAAERLYLERLVPSHDGNEGIEAFIARRPPAWRDA